MINTCKIPKIIHQTWKNNEIPEKWKKSKEMWIKLHPDWKYILWTDKMIRNYLKRKYPSYLELHDSYKYPIQRADMIRYFILKDFGGIYSDLDLYPIENLEKYFTHNDNESYFVFSGNYQCFTNSFMASKLNAQIWDVVLKELLKRKNIRLGRHFTVMMTTGPMMLNDAINKHDMLIGLLPKKKFMAYSTNDEINLIKKSAILLPLKGCSWNGIDSYILNKINKYKINILVSIILTYIYLLFYFIKKKIYKLTN